jgi:hypothetical protein
VNARQLLGLGYMKRDENGFVGMHRISKGMPRAVRRWARPAPDDGELLLRVAAERVAACGADLHKGVYHCEIVIASVPVEQSVQMRLYLGRFSLSTKVQTSSLMRTHTTLSSDSMCGTHPSRAHVHSAH